jgi:hypothetical protein
LRDRACIERGQDTLEDQLSCSCGHHLPLWCAHAGAVWLGGSAWPALAHAAARTAIASLGRERLAECAALRCGALDDDGAGRGGRGRTGGGNDVFAPLRAERAWAARCGEI